MPATLRSVLLRPVLLRASGCLLVGATLFSCLLSCVIAPETERLAERSAPAEWSLFGQASQARSAQGMVASGHPLASAIGADILAQGGNAIDAAVALGFALAVVLPEAGNLGGGGFLVHRSADGAVRTLDYRETAPAGASRDMYLDARGEPTDRSVTGHLAAGVPGSVAGLAAMHEQLGSLPWPALIEPAIELARGHLVDEVRRQHLSSSASRLSRFPASATQFLPGGEPPAAGELWSQPDLVKTLEAIRDHGQAGFYRGWVADRIEEEMERGGGMIDREDLAAYRALWREPVELTYRGQTIYSMGPPSSGGLTLALVLNMLEGFDVAADADSAQRRHVQAETMRRGFIDRNRFLGDPDFVEVPFEKLQSQLYADELRAQIDLDRATATPVELLTVNEGDHTTHYSVVDASGNAASITTTINSAYGSAVTVTGAGFLLNNEMDDFAAAPGKPNQFGLVEGENNAIAPGKRMLSSMTPSIVLDGDGELLLVLGSPGGPTIITTVLQVITNVVDFQMDLARAVESPRVHHQALPDVLFYEPAGLAPVVVEELSAMGHELRQRSSTSGDIAAIQRVDDEWLGVSDPRRGGGVAAPRRP